jgi:protein tyrosine/serine phosphatase
VSHRVISSKLCAALLGLALATTGIAAQSTSALPEDGNAARALAERPAAWSKPIDAARNLYQITPTLYRSAQPEPRDTAALQALGIRTIINLRANHDDAAVLDLPGVKLLRIPIDTWKIGDAQVLSALRAIEQAQKDGPVLIHCQHGADRTGTVTAMYRILNQGWTREQALAELTQGNHGFHRIWVNIPRYIRSADIEALRAQLAQP